MKGNKSYLFSDFKRKVQELLHFIVRWARSKKHLKIGTDQIERPTWCRTLGIATTHELLCGNTDPLNWIARHAGIYHIAGKGHCSHNDLVQ